MSDHFTANQDVMGDAERPATGRRVLITGAASAVAQNLISHLVDFGCDVIACDARAPEKMPLGAQFCPMDVTTDAPLRVMARYQPNVVVHLDNDHLGTQHVSSSEAYQVEVVGTRNVVNAALAVDADRLVVTSAAAAYGYHADNPVPLRETHPIRGNKNLAFAYHKRLVEELLYEVRVNAPQLEQVVLRVGTVLGDGVHTTTSTFLSRQRLLAVKGTKVRYRFVSPCDLVRILLRAATTGPQGVYNVVGDGDVTTAQLGSLLEKKVIEVPGWAIKPVMRIAYMLRMCPFEAEQADVLKYRPVLCNDALKRDFGYTPRHTSIEVLEGWRKSF